MILTIFDSITKFSFQKTIWTCFYYNTDYILVNSKVSETHSVLFLDLKFEVNKCFTGLQQQAQKCDDISTPIK